MTEPSIVLKLATAFARHLDVADFRGAEALLAPSCIYTFRNQEIVGPKDIVDSYESNDKWAKSVFDSVKYASRIVEYTEATATLEFSDDIQHGEHRLEHSCHQVITVGESEQIVGIAHIDLPGEREKVESFNARCGVKRWCERIA